MSSGISMFSSIILSVVIVVFLLLFIMKEGVGYLLAAFLLFIIYAVTLGLTVEKEKIIRHIFVFNKSIHRRVLNPEDIEKMVIHHMGLGRKKVVIVIRRGKNVHVAEAKHEVMESLEKFSEYHSIPIDYGKIYKRM